MKRARSALDVQVGGDHYKDLNPQPIELILGNNLGYVEGSVVKRMCRWDHPNGGGVEDLEKAIHEIQLLIEHTKKNV